MFRILTFVFCSAFFMSTWCNICFLFSFVFFVVIVEHFDLTFVVCRWTRCSCRWFYCCICCHCCSCCLLLLFLLLLSILDLPFADEPVVLVVGVVLCIPPVVEISDWWIFSFSFSIPLEIEAFLYSKQWIIRLKNF